MKKLLEVLIILFIFTGCTHNFHSEGLSGGRNKTLVDFNGKLVSGKVQVETVDSYGIDKENLKGWANVEKGHFTDEYVVFNRDGSKREIGKGKIIDEKTRRWQGKIKYDIKDYSYRIDNSTYNYTIKGYVEGSWNLDSYKVFDGIDLKRSVVYASPANISNLLNMYINEAELVYESELGDKYVVKIEDNHVRYYSVMYKEKLIHEVKFGKMNKKGEFDVKIFTRRGIEKENDSNMTIIRMYFVNSIGKFDNALTINIDGRARYESKNNKNWIRLKPETNYEIKDINGKIIWDDTIYIKANNGGIASFEYNWNNLQYGNQYPSEKEISSFWGVITAIINNPKDKFNE